MGKQSERGSPIPPLPHPLAGIVPRGPVPLVDHAWSQIPDRSRQFDPRASALGLPDQLGESIQLAAPVALHGDHGKHFVRI
jgi:hypothetical protein